jgi:hypothetical protein
MMIRDLATVERQLGFSYEMDQSPEHYQRICPRCRRALFGLAQASAWGEQLTERVSTASR